MKIQIIKGDITTSQADAIVNAANNSLLGGGGVDGAIHRAAGFELYQECLKLNGCPTGEAKITKGYNLQANYIIHTVGPIWQGGNDNEIDLLRKCYINSLELAITYELNSIAFPSISTGVYDFPLELASKIALKQLLQYSNRLEIYVYAFDDLTFSTYNKYLSYES
jgi:O-acetyl-ADP-ribose deacetylase (regulator of RNase III)